MSSWVTLLPACALLAGNAMAATLAVNCDAGITILRGIFAASDGDTLVVSGTCRETVFIPADYAHLVFDGQGKATIISPDAASDVVTIAGHDITFRGFTVTGGSNGISVVRSGTVLLDGNTVQDTGKGAGQADGNGIQVMQHSFAFITNNTIQNNPGHGIVVQESSAARIGFIDESAASISPNKILTNGRDGIHVTHGGEARIAGAVVTGNQGDGIHIEKRSHAELAGSIISGNAKNGVLVTGGSGLDMEIGSGLVTTPNSTDADKPNGAGGVKCAVGSYANGVLGSLAGNAGVKDADKTCIDNLTP